MTQGLEMLGGSATPNSACLGHTEKGSQHHQHRGSAKTLDRPRASAASTSRTTYSTTCTSILLVLVLQVPEAVLVLVLLARLLYSRNVCEGTTTCQPQALNRDVGEPTSQPQAAKR